MSSGIDFNFFADDGKDSAPLSTRDSGISATTSEENTVIIKDHQNNFQSNSLNETDSSSSSAGGGAKNDFFKIPINYQEQAQNNDLQVNEETPSAATSVESDGNLTDVSPLDSPREVNCRKQKRGKEKKNLARTFSHDGFLNKGIECSTFHKPKIGGFHNRSATNIPYVDIDEDPFSTNLLMQAVLDLDRYKQNFTLPMKNESLFYNKRIPVFGKYRNYTFTNDEAKCIDRENQRLLRELLRETKPKASKSNLKANDILTPPRKVTPFMMQKMFQDRQIDRDNLNILKRLQNVKPTRGYTREEQLKDWHRQVSSYGISPATHGFKRSTTCRKKTKPRSAVDRSSLLQSSSLTSSESDIRRSKKKTNVSSGKRLLDHHSDNVQSDEAKRYVARPSSAKFRHRPTARPAWDDRW